MNSLPTVSTFPPLSPPSIPETDFFPESEKAPPRQRRGSGGGLTALLRALPPAAWATQARLVRHLEEFLRREGFPVRRDVRVGDMGTGRGGSIPLVVQTTPPVAIGVDRQRPSPRSVLVLSRFPGRRVIVLRAPVRVGRWSLAGGIFVVAVPVPPLGRDGGAGALGGEQVLALLDLGSRHLGLRGVSPKSPFGVRVRRQIVRRLGEGFSPDDLRRVLDWAAARGRQGERYPGRNLLYLWGGQFPVHLADAESRSGRAPTFRSGDALRAFDERARRAQQRSLAHADGGERV